MATLDNVAARNQQFLGTTLKTTDATQTVAWRFPTKADTAYFVDLKVVATETTDHDEVATYWRQACYKNDGGTLTLVGAEREVVTDNESTGAWDIELAVGTEDVEGDGTNEKTIQCKVTGAASTNITWRVIADVYEIS